MRQDEEADGFRARHGVAGLAASHFAAVGRPQGIGPQARKRIGTHLRALYESVLQQPVPERFTDLIAQLDDAPPESDPGEAGCGGIGRPS